MMRLRRFLLALGLVAGATLFAMAPASAQDYPPEEPLLSVSATTVVVGDTVILSGAGFEPGEEIEITVSTTPFAAGSFDSDGSEPISFVLVSQSLAQAQQTVFADGDGDFSASVTLTEVGTATIVATGLSSGLSGSVTVTVLAEEPLPLTGESLGWMLRVGGGAVLLGVLLVGSVVLWRRRLATAEA